MKLRVKTVGVMLCNVDEKSLYYLVINKEKMTEIAKMMEQGLDGSSHE